MDHLICFIVSGLVLVASREHREPGPGAGADVESGGLTSQHQGQPKHSQHCPMILSM